MNPEEPYAVRQYLTSFDSNRTGNILTDVLVIGSGVAGMRAALAASENAMVTLITKADLHQSCTNLAQGGIAVAIDEQDNPADHMADTLRVGCGLSNRAAVEFLVSDAPQRIRELMDWGMPFDHDDEALDLGREGGHGRNRIVHSDGDQTGKALSKTLARRMLATRNIRVFQPCFLIDFLVADGVCVGAVTFQPKYGHQLIWAKQTILASGGCGRLWRETTNPEVATADGLAAAFRAGAALVSLEFMQFHPTTLYVAGAGRALVSEAVRGAGGYLVDRKGHRFMSDFDEAGELAPRDIVSRAIHTHLRQTRANSVYLDVRHIPDIRNRFPHLAKLCDAFEIDIDTDLIPVRPSAHYMIGGVQVDLNGQTALDGLLACGEVAYTGVHGANRLASNSLLEGLVFGRRAGEHAATQAAGIAGNRIRRIINRNDVSQRTELDLADIQHSLRSVMWRNAGIVRSADRLVETQDILRFWAHYTLDKTLNAPTAWETQNLLTLAYLVTLSALARTQSIGVHCRDDTQPQTDDSRYLVRVTLTNGDVDVARQNLP